MLDIVFAVSCVLMLASLVWMFVDDYNRGLQKGPETFSVGRRHPDRKSGGMLGETAGRRQGDGGFRSWSAAETFRRVSPRSRMTMNRLTAQPLPGQGQTGGQVSEHQGRLRFLRQLVEYRDRQGWRHRATPGEQETIAQISRETACKEVDRLKQRIDCRPNGSGCHRQESCREKQVTPEESRKTICQMRRMT